MNVKFKKLMSVLLCCVMLIGMIPVDTFATTENVDDSIAAEGTVTEAPSGDVPVADPPVIPELPSQEEPAKEPVAEEPADNEPVDDEPAAEAPADDDQPVADPAQELYKKLMGFATYEELRAFMDAMTAEQLEVMNLFTYEQTQALNERMKALKGEPVAPVSEEPVADEPVADEAADEPGEVDEITETEESTENTESVKPQMTETGADDAALAERRPQYYYDHIDIRQQGASIAMTYITKNMVTGEVLSTRTVTIDCRVSAISSVTYTQLRGTDDERSWTWTSGFSGGSGGYEFRKMNLQLYADGVSYGDPVVVNDANNWTYTWTNLPRNNAGEEISYTVDETFVPTDYEKEIAGNAAVGYTITNSHTPETVEVSGSKTWKDNDDQDGARPESITIRLLADGVEKDRVTVTKDDNWAWSFTNQPKYKDHGTAIVYVITEDAVEDYTTAYNGYNVTNTHTPEQTSVTVSKSWKENNDQDGIRPDEITVILLKNGEPFKSQKIDADDNWTYTFTKLDAYAKGEKIVYTVEEKAVEGYETVITGDAVHGYIITNSHTPEVIEKLSGTKTWDDDNNRDGVRPESITVHLKADGKEVAQTTVTAENGWTYEFTNLPKYEEGHEIVYTVVEDAVDGYSVEYNKNNLDIKNHRTPGKTSITVTKRWIDGHDNDDIRPGSVTIYLYANDKQIDSLKLTAKDNWIGVFDNLYIYENGEATEYTIEEKAVPGYNTTITGSAEQGFTVTNTHNIIPKTGDDSNLPLYTGMFGAGFSAMAVLLFLAKPRKKEKYLR